VRYFEVKSTIIRLTCAAAGTAFQMANLLKSKVGHLHSRLGVNSAKSTSSVLRNEDLPPSPPPQDSLADQSCC
jgi:hypothetical protein